MANRMRGLVPIATGLDGAGHAGGRSGAVVDSNADSALSALAGEFADIGNRIGRMADKAAAREGDIEGRFAGLDPEFRTRRDNTIRGDAFDRAGLQTAETRLKTQLDVGFDGAYEKHGADPQKLQQALAAQASGVLSGAPDELKPELQQLAARKSFGLMRQSQRELIARTRAEETAALQEELQRNLRGIQQRAFGLGLDASADQVIAGDMAELTRTLLRKGVDDKPLIGRAQAAKLLEAVKQDVTEARLLGAFDRLPSLDAKRQFLAEFEKDFGRSAGLAAQFDFDGFRRVGGMLGSELRRAEAEQHKIDTLIGREVRDIADLAEKGFAPPAEALAAVKARVASSGSPALEAALGVAEETLRWQQSARRRTPAELDGYAAQLRDVARQSGATPAMAARIKVAETLAEEARRELKQDPLGWADRVGLVDVPPLDLQDLAGSVKNRIAIAETVAQRYGIEPEYVRPDERQRLAAMAAQGGDQLLGVATTVAGTAGDRAPAIMAEIGKDAPVVALIGSHVITSGKTKLASDAAAGIALMRTEGHKPVAPPAKDARQYAVKGHGGALSGEGYQAFEQTTIAAANAAYEMRHRVRGLAEFDADLWTKTYREVLGEREIGGEIYGGIAVAKDGRFWGGEGAVIVPPDVRQDGFHDLVDAVRIEDFTAAPRHGDGTAATIADIRRARLEQAGPGRYWLNLGTPEAPRYLQSPSAREPFVLDIEAMKSTLQKRRPDLYLGGGR